MFVCCEYAILSSLSRGKNVLKNLLPTKNTTTSKLIQKQVTQKLQDIEATTDSNVRRRLAHEAITCLPVQKENQPVLRGDLLVSDSAGHRKDKLLDFSGIHTSSSGVRNQQYNDLVAHQIREAALLKTGLIASDDGETYACRKAVQRKHRKYDIIQTLANIQASAYGVSRPLTFIAAIITHRGELSSELMNFVSSCTARFKALKKLSPAMCGLTPSQAAAKYRSDLKTALYCQMARGWGRQLVATRAMGACALETLQGAVLSCLFLSCLVLSCLVFVFVVFVVSLCLVCVLCLLLLVLF